MIIGKDTNIVDLEFNPQVPAGARGTIPSKTKPFKVISGLALKKNIEDTKRDIVKVDANKLRETLNNKQFKFKTNDKLEKEFGDPPTAKQSEGVSSGFVTPHIPMLPSIDQIQPAENQPELDYTSEEGQKSVVKKRPKAILKSNSSKKKLPYKLRDADSVSLIIQFHTIDLHGVYSKLTMLQCLRTALKEMYTNIKFPWEEV